jgi:uncharacterized protein with von Willebrand factor type A (vWA) domain
MANLWQSKIESVLAADRFDLQDWRSATEAIPVVDAADQSATNQFCGHPVQDAFLSLFKSAPRLAEPIPNGLEPLADLVRRGMETPQWVRLRENTVGDLVGAGVGAAAFVEETLKALPDDAKKQAQDQSKAQHEADRLCDKAESLETLADLLRQQADAKVESDPQAAASLGEEAESVSQRAFEARQKADTAQRQADAMCAAFEAKANANAPQLAAALNAAARKAGEKASDASEIVRGFSLAAGGDPSHVDVNMARAAMEALRVNPNLRRLAEMLGWAKKMVRGEWRKSSHAKAEMVGYAVHDLRPETMAPVEWAALLAGDATLTLDWLRRAADGGIRHRRFHGKEQQGRGPLVLVRDESGSMASLPGQAVAPHALAVVLEWALLEIARRDRREFYSIPFSGEGQYQVWQAPPPGQPDPDGLLAHLSHFYNGGTEPYRPLVAALELIERSRLRADVLILTDAAFNSPSDEFTRRLAEVKQRQPLRTVAVVIGGDGEAAQEFADRVIGIDDLIAGREQLRDAVAAIV